MEQTTAMAMTIILIMVTEPLELPRRRKEGRVLEPLPGIAAILAPALP